MSGLERLSDAGLSGAAAGTASSQIPVFSVALGRYVPSANTPADNPNYATHNFGPTSLKYTKAAIAAARTNTRDFRIGCQGDSIPAVGPTTVPFFARAATILGQRLGIPVRAGLVPISVNGTVSSQWTVGSGWAINGNALGNSLQWYYQAAGGTGVLDFTPTDDAGVAIQCDSFVVYAYAGGTAGSFQWSIDGGSYTTQVNTGASGCKAYTLSTGGRGFHTLHIKPPATGNGPLILGAEAVDSTIRGIRYCGGGQGGNTTPASYSINGSGGDVLQAFGADLVMFQWNTNEYGLQVPLATFKANMQAVAPVPQTFTKPADTLWLASPPQSDTSKTIPQSQYYATMDAASDAVGFPVLHLDRQLISYAVSNPSPISFYVDGVHPNDAGHNYWGATIATLLASL